MKGVLTAVDKLFIARMVKQNKTTPEIARKLTRNEHTVEGYIWREGLRPKTLRHHRWTADEDDYIRSGLDQGWSSYRLSQGLHQPTENIRRRAYDLGYTAQAINYSVRRTAAMFGVSDKIINVWIRNKYIAAYNNSLRKLNHYLISEEALYDFLEDEKTWHLWDAERITDGLIRSHALAIREGTSWLTMKELGKHLGYSTEGLRRYIYLGWIRVIRRGRGCAFAIREDWVADAQERMRDSGPPWWGDDPLDRPLWLTQWA